MSLRPLWLATPSRFAALKPAHARIALALLALLLLATLLALGDPAPRVEDQADLVRTETIVQGLRGGGDYYSVAAKALRDAEAPMRPFLAFRLPTLAVIEAAFPQVVASLLLYALTAGVLFAWFLRLAPAFPRAPPRWFALALLAGGMVGSVEGELSSVHEVWAGLLIALSLGVRRDDRWIEAVALGLIAMLTAESAAFFAIVMGLLAFAEGNRREAVAWGGALAVFCLVLAFHAHAVTQVVRPTDPGFGWMDPPGFGFFVQAARVSTVLAAAPMWLAAPLIGLAMFGWAAWATPLALRALVSFALYAAVFGLFGRPDSVYCGLMIAPILLIGLAFAPDGMRDLIAAARTPRRKITVTRVTR